jgi:hypothetical protein
VLEESDLKGIDMVDAELLKVKASKERIINDAAQQLHSGLSSQVLMMILFIFPSIPSGNFYVSEQNQADIASSLQVFRNLGHMASTAQKVVDTMLDNITKETQKALDPALLSKELSGTMPFITIDAKIYL